MNKLKDYLLIEFEVVSFEFNDFEENYFNADLKFYLNHKKVFSKSKTELNKIIKEANVKKPLIINTFDSSEIFRQITILDIFTDKQLIDCLGEENIILNHNGLSEDYLSDYIPICRIDPTKCQFMEFNFNKFICNLDNSKKWYNELSDFIFWVKKSTLNLKEHEGLTTKKHKNKNFVFYVFDRFLLSESLLSNQGIYKNSILDKFKNN